MLLLPIFIVIGSFLQIVISILRLIPFVMPSLVVSVLRFSLGKIAELDGILPIFQHDGIGVLNSAFGLVDVMSAFVVLLAAVVIYKLIPGKKLLGREG